MNAPECAAFLQTYIDNVPDEALLEYLLSVLKEPDESQTSKDDLLYSLLPELGLLEERTRTYVIDCLGPRDRSNSNPRDNYKQSATSGTEGVHGDEYEPVRVELHDLLCTMGCADVASTLDNTIVGFLLNTFGNGQENDEENTGRGYGGGEGGAGGEPAMDEEEQLDLLRAYLEGVPEDNQAAIVAFFKRCAAEMKENRAIQAGIAADTRASELNSRLQSIAADTRVSRPAISPAEAAERARLVDKFGEAEVRAKYDAKGNLNEAKPVNLVIFVPNPKLESKVRYRDNNIVTHNGGKFIIEKEEEYDCGLRGRVKSKGKRGAGVGKGL